MRFPIFNKTVLLFNLAQVGSIKLKEFPTANKKEGIPGKYSSAPAYKFHELGVLKASWKGVLMLLSLMTLLTAPRAG